MCVHIVLPFVTSSGFHVYCPIYKYHKYLPLENEVCMHHGIGYMVVYPLVWTSDLDPYPLLNVTSDLPQPLLLASGGHHWRPVQTCSLEDLPPPSPPLTSGGGYRGDTSYWTAIFQTKCP